MNSIIRSLKVSKLQHLKLKLSRLQAINETISEIELGSGIINKIKRVLMLPQLKAEQEFLSENRFSYEDEIAKIEEELN